MRILKHMLTWRGDEADWSIVVGLAGLALLYLAT